VVTELQVKELTSRSSPALYGAGLNSSLDLKNKKTENNMKKQAILIISLLFYASLSFAGDVITAKEVQSCFYAEGKMRCSDGEYKNTYYRDGDKIIRTNVFHLGKKESVSDDTVYKVIGELSSDPRNNTGALFPQVTRAIGFPGADAVEIISIEKNYIQAVKSTSNYFVVSRFKIEKE